MGDWIPIGKEATSEIVAAGKYQLVGRMVGGRTGTVDVQLVDGETTSVVLTLR